MIELPSLPVQAVLADVILALSAHHQLVLEAPPGAGKTTVVPLALLDQVWLVGRKIILLQPRRMAARAVAERMAHLLGESVGQQVGYRVRLDSRISSLTRIEVVTEGILTRMLLDDPALDGVGLVIFDEFHERNLESDLGLALCLQGRRLFRDETCPLKILVMSATLNGDRVAALLDQAPVVRCQGLMFPVSLHYGVMQNAGESIVAPVVQTVLHALRQHEGSVLVFLPGQSEILRVQEALEKQLPAEARRQTEILPLYGSLPLAAQQRAIAPCVAGDEAQRKVVLATDIAETSLTIEGISVVVDAGLKRVAEFDPARGMSRLRTRRVSVAASIQRMGRAGRLAAGHCYRLWTENQQQQLLAYDSPEILQADLCALALHLLNWGVSDPAELDWLDPPPSGAFNQALQLLTALGAVTRDLASRPVLTEHGRAMAQWPVHPRLAHMLQCASAMGVLKEASLLAALLIERDPFRMEGADITRRMQRLTGEMPCETAQRAWMSRVQQQAQGYRKNVTVVDRKLPVSQDELWALLLAHAYPDRIAKRRPGQQAVYQLSQGNAVSLAEDDPLAAFDWLVVADMGGISGQQDRIFLAAALNPVYFTDYLSAQVHSKELVEWDQQSQRFIAEQQACVGQVVIHRRKLSVVPLEAKREALITQIRKQGLSSLPWTETLRQWRARVTLLHQSGLPQEGWPDLSDAALLASLDTWLGPYLDPISSLKALEQLDLEAILATQLPWPLPQKLEEQAPSTWCVPSGSRIRIDYLQSPPVLAVKLQEMFACVDTPSVLQGRIPLMLHLLSPAQRPLQITQDLAGFWRGSYHEIKKEMKGRYPKHPWPDDPLNAAPTRFTKKRV